MQRRTKKCVVCKQPVCQRHARGYADDKTVCQRCWRNGDAERAYKATPEIFNPEGDPKC